MFGILNKPARNNTWFVTNPMSDLPYDIGDMRNSDQQSYHAEVSDYVHKASLSISHHLEQSKVFSEASNLISADKLKLYLEFAVSNEIYPVYIAEYIADWHHNRLTTQSYPIYWEDHKGLGELLAKHWADNSPVLILGRRENIYRLIKRNIKPMYSKLLYLHWKIKSLFSRFIHREYFIPEGPNILVKYAVGINENGRNDLFWLDSDICSHPNHIVYFDEPVDSSAVKKDISYLTNVLGSMNVCYVNLFRQNLPANDCLTIPRSWKPGPLTKHFKSLHLHADTDYEKWLINSLKELLIDVDYWVSVYNQLNVKIHVDISVGTPTHIAQNIALDIINGIGITWQRSELLPNFSAYLGWYPCHIFLSWNSRASLPLIQNRSRVSSIVIIGIADEDLLAHRLKSTSSWYAGKHLEQFFTVALFDNMFFRTDLFSKSMIMKLYVEFLKWVISDDRVAVINKPKRWLILEQLPELDDLMYKAESTGRWINLIEKRNHLNSIDYLPIDASSRADISVGIGISSAVTEAIAYGAKGIYCDLPQLKEHPFYDWGYNQVIFTDISVMMNALRAYKSSSIPLTSLGNFKDHMDQIDPFHDAKQHDRVALYLRWLVDGFQNGLTRVETISQANHSYRGLYGEDKIIDITVLSQYD